MKDRTPEDAAQIVERICGVCPVSHAHASSIAAEKAYGIEISNNARIIRNLIEGAQFLHSHILWFYNLAGLDYVNPLNALKANVGDAYDLAAAKGCATASDMYALKEHLSQFAENGQLSIFSGNWFDAEDGTGYKLPAELDLILTAHYLEALKMQSKASEIAALLGGKMPHIMTIVPGGTAFVPTASKLDDLKGLVDEVYNWVEATMLPDVLALAPYYTDALNWGKGCGRYIAWGVFENKSMLLNERYMPAGVLQDGLKLEDVDTSKIAEYVGHSWYKGDATRQSPDYTTGSRVHRVLQGRLGHGQRPLLLGQVPGLRRQADGGGSLSRILVAYKRNVPFIVKHVDAVLEALGAPGNLNALGSTLGRTGIRQVETLYIASLMKEWVDELLIEAVKSGDSEYFREVRPHLRRGRGSLGGTARRTLPC